MLVWKAMPSITEMMSEIFLLDAVIASIVDTTAPTARPPCVAAALAEFASWLAWRAVSALSLTVAVSCSIEAEVCCRFEACSSVRWDRSALPDAIWPEPVAMESELWRTWPTMSTRRSRMAFIVASMLVVSPGRTVTSLARSPSAMRRAAAAA